MPEFATDTVVFEGGDALKSLEVKDGMARVGAYGIRFSDANQKDLTGEYFTKDTDFGPRNGDGVATMFGHGATIAPGLEHLASKMFAPVRVVKDDIGLFIETVLNLHDEYEKAVYGLIDTEKSVLRWSSGSASHIVKTAPDGQILRWHPIEFSYTPTPAEKRLPRIQPLKSVSIDQASADEIKAAFDTKPAEAVQSTTVTVVDNSSGGMTDADKAAFEKATQQSADERVDARSKEVSEIFAIGSQIKDLDIARKFVADGKTLNEFRQHVLENVLKAKPVEADAKTIGMNKGEVKSYSLLKAIREFASKAGLTGLEKEAHDTAVKQYGRDELKGFLVPDDVTRMFSRRAVKAQNATTSTAGGFLVETDMGPMIELLRNMPVVVQAGATTLGGLVGDVALPRHVSGATAYWVSETGSLTDSQSVFGQKKLTPKRLGCTIPYSTQFLAQSSIDAESFIRDDATKVLSIEKDRASLAGSGVGGEPLGVALDPDINATVTYSGAAAWADIVEHETGISVDNADIGSMAFVINAATRGKWKTILKDSVAGAGYLISEDGRANGYPVYVTNQTFSVASQSFFGVWSQLILASWAGLEVIVDPFALKKSGQVEITFNELCDILVRQPLAFNISTDTAAA